MEAAKLRRESLGEFSCFIGWDDPTMPKNRATGKTGRARVICEATFNPVEFARRNVAGPASEKLVLGIELRDL